MLHSCYRDSLDGIDLKDIKAVTYGIPGSGSTFVWQIVNALLGDGVIKTHSYLDLPPGTPLIVSIRDPRAALISNHRMVNGDIPLPEYQGLVERVSTFVKHCFISEQMRQHPTAKVAVLFYEQFTDNPVGTVTSLSQFLDVTTSMNDWSAIAAKFSPEANATRSDAVSGDYDQETLLHRRHVHGVANSYGRYFCGEGNWQLLTCLLKDQIDWLGYGES